MKLLKKLLLVILGVVAMGSGVYWAKSQGYFDNTPLAQVSLPQLQLPSLASLSPKNLTKNLNKENLENISKDAEQQTQTLTSKAKEVGEHAQNVLGDSIQADEEQPPLHERAIEYGQYIYCKGVVEEYEKQ